jgi:hypothetical protein
VYTAGRALDQRERDAQALACIEALDGQLFFVADLVLRRFRIFNLRNPFPPTPHDIREHCDWTEFVLRDAVWKTALCGEKWRTYSSKLPLGWFGEPGPEPFSPGCLVPDDTACKWIRDRIARDVEIDGLQRFTETSYENYKRRWSTPPDFLRHSSQSAVRKLPDAALPDGFRSVHEAAASHWEKLNKQERDEREADRKRRREQGKDWD